VAFAGQCDRQDMSLPLAHLAGIPVEETALMLLRCGPMPSSCLAPRLVDSAAGCRGRPAIGTRTLVPMELGRTTERRLF